MFALPLKLFFILFGMTLFFGAASANGTMPGLAARGVRLVRGRRAMLPPAFFVLGAAFAATGAGNIAACALLAPLVMAVAGRAGLPAFLSTVMLVNGANAGAFSPLAPTGIIANGLVAAQGLAMDPWREVFLPSLAAQTAIAAAAYLLFGGLSLEGGSAEPDEAAPAPWTREQRLTLAAIAALAAAVGGLRLDPGLAAVVLAAVLAAARAADLRAALDEVPGTAILTVCGVSALIGLLEKLGVMELFTGLLAAWSTPRTATGVVALVAGLFSTVSSSSGVVMPAMIPLVPGLAARLGGGDAAALVAAVNVGSHVVDVSPLSTLGALCVAHAPAGEDKKRLFRRLLLNGLAMAGAGAAACQLLFRFAP